MKRFEAVVTYSDGKAFTRFPVHADSEQEAIEQARNVFLIMHSDLTITEYRFKLNEIPRSPGV